MRHKTQEPELKAKDILIKFLEGFPDINPDIVREIAERITVESFKKGTILLQEGAIPKNCYYVLQGCLRQYKICEGVDRTIEFFTEKNGAVSSENYFTQSISDHNLACIEDSVLIIGDPIRDQKMFATYPVLESITRKMMEQEWGKTQKAFADFMTSSPEERYLNLLQSRPELLERVPQHQIAGYLGITAESLSRIRKRIISKAYRV